MDHQVENMVLKSPGCPTIPNLLVAVLKGIFGR